MKGIVLKGLLRDYYPCFEKYSGYRTERGLEYFLELDESILEELVLDPESNFVDSSTYELLYDLAFFKYDVDEVVAILRKAKTYNPEDLQTFYLIISSLKEVESSEEKYRAFLTILRYSKNINNLSYFPKYVEGIAEKDEASINVDFLYADIDDLEVQKLMELKALMADVLYAKSIDSFDKNVVTYLAGHIQNTEGETKEKYREILNILYNYRSLFEDFRNAKENAQYEIVLKMLSYIVSCDVSGLWTYLEFLSDFNINYRQTEEFVIFINTELGEKNPEGKAYENITKVCDALGLKFESRDKEELLKIAALTDEELRRILIFIEHSDREIRNISIKVLMDKANYDRLTELTEAVSNGVIDVNRLLTGKESLYRILNDEVSITGSFDQLVDSIPDDAEVTKDTVKFTLSNKRKN